MDGFQALTRGLRNTKEAAAGLSGLTITDLLLVTAWVWGSLVDPGPPLSQAAFQKLIQIWVAKNSLGPPARPNGAGKRSAGDEWANQSPRGLLPCDQRKETAEGAWKIKKLPLIKKEATLPSKPAETKLTFYCYSPRSLQNSALRKRPVVLLIRS